MPFAPFASVGAGPRRAVRFGPEKEKEENRDEVQQPARRFPGAGSARTCTTRSSGWSRLSNAKNPLKTRSFFILHYTSCPQKTLSAGVVGCSYWQALSPLAYPGPARNLPPRRG